MLNTKYDVLVRNGKERFVVIPMKEYEAMRERLEDEADFRASKRRRNGRRVRHERRCNRSSANWA